jgi:CzcA family heavy metal efflux pump
MLSALVRFSLSFKGVILSLALVLLGYGLYSFSQVNYDVFPEFAPPLVEVQTEAPGLAPEQVEVLVTQAIENALNGVSRMESIRSTSIQGLSVITVTLRPGGDIYRDRQSIAERLATLTGQLPQGVQAPVMSPLTSSTGDLMTLGFTSKKLSLMELRTLTDTLVRQRLLAVPGVAKIGTFGGEVKQMQIQVHPEKLVQYNLSLENVLTVATRATGLRGAGFIDTPKERILIQTEGQSLTPEELGKTVIVYSFGNNITGSVALREVADIVWAPAPPISAASVMGQPGVVLNLWAQYQANTMETTRKVDKALEELKPLLDSKGVMLYPDLFRASRFIDTSIHNLKLSLLLGAVLVVLILFLFLFNLRTAAISCTAIPLSLLAALAVLRHFGFSLNTMTLGGLAIAIGEVVDDAVIDVENILRRLRENRRLEKPLSAIRVVYAASLEVRSAVVYATFAVALVFIPVLTMSGLAGRLFAPLGLCYVLAILASLLVALTVTPAFALLLLGKSDLPQKDPPLQRVLVKIYRALLEKIERIPRTVMAVAFLFMLGGLALLPFLEKDFLPSLREGHFLIHLTAPPGTSLQESLRLGGEISKGLLEIPSIRTVAQRVGRAAIDDTYGPHASELEVDLKSSEGADFEETEEQIKKIFEKFPQINVEVNTFLAERIEETLSGFTEPVVINIFGNNLDVLDKKAQEVLTVLKTVPGAEEAQIQEAVGTPELSVRLRKEDLVYWGFDPVDVLEAIFTAYQGNVVGQVFQGNQIFDVTVVLNARNRQSVEEVGSLPLKNPSGTYVRLRQIADIQKASGRYAVLHAGARRVQTVTCDVSEGGIPAFVEEAKKKIAAAVQFPVGTELQFSGEAEEQSRSQRDLLVHSALAGIGILLLISMVTRRFRNMLLVMANLPFAMVGGLIIAYFSGDRISIGSLVGFVTLFGITLRNSIMMISHFEHLVSEEGMTWGPETALRGASERLIPILMTALVTAFGLLPLALGSGAPGREIEGPMATVILGGLITSTLLNLLVLPTLALRYGRFEKSEIIF